MPLWLEVILEIIKITVPALIVFVTVYQLLKQHNQNQEKIKVLEINERRTKTTLPLRLQAYERLSMFLERINIPSLIIRVRDENMTSKDLQYALIAAIQQEYEHNITQQVYVSEDLWKIINIAKNDTISLVNSVGKSQGLDGSALELSKALFAAQDEKQAKVISVAKNAVRKEATAFLGMRG